MTSYSHVPMHLQNLEDIRVLLAETPQLRDALKAVRKLDLPDAWIGAGLLRNAVWDRIHGFAFAAPNDVDVAFFDPATLAPEYDARLQQRLTSLAPAYPWDVKNQARMHERHEHPVYKGTLDAISHWVETATAIAARLDENGDVELAAPHGFDDLLALTIRPVPSHATDLSAFEERLVRKRWRDRWPRLRVVRPDSGPLPNSPTAVDS